MAGSSVDTGNQILLLFGLKQAKKPPDEKYPFGHGKEVYFWSFVVALLIFAVGAGLSIYKGVEHIKHPREITDIFWNYLVLGMAMLIEGHVFFVAVKEFNKYRGESGYLEAIQKGKDPGMFVVLLEDAAAMTGLAVAMVGITVSEVTGSYVFDGIASVIIGLILALVAVLLAVETKGLLIGESANRQVVEGIRHLLNQTRGVQKVNEVLTMHMGPEYILVNLSVEFSDHFRTDKMEILISQIDREIKARYKHVKRVLIEAEAHA